jgi:hypothetical protein
MDKLVLLSQDKETLRQVREFMTSTMERKLISKALRKEDVSGFAEANEIIKSALDEIDNLSKKDKKPLNINQSE